MIDSPGAALARSVAAVVIASQLGRRCSGVVIRWRWRSINSPGGRWGGCRFDRLHHRRQAVALVNVSRALGSIARGCGVVIGTDGDVVAVVIRFTEAATCRGCRAFPVAWSVRSLGPGSRLAVGRCDRYPWRSVRVGGRSIHRGDVGPVVIGSRSFASSSINPAGGNVSRACGSINCGGRHRVAAWAAMWWRFHRITWANSGRL